MSLRARLLFVTVGLVTLGLLIADVVTYRALSSSLLERVDEQLVQTSQAAVAALGSDGFPMPDGSDGGSGYGPPAGSYAALLDESGTVVRAHSFEYEPGQQNPAVPQLPPDLPGSTNGGVGTTTFSASSDGGTRFRVEAVGPRPNAGTLVIAVPLTEMGETLGRLLAIEALVTIGVALTAGALALWLVKVGLRPLETMGATAGAIAAGDLSRRVEPADDTTEIGKLGTSLNAMLAQIEAAFEERRASEDRLRRFVGDASHELRTPITSIRGYAELFRRGADTRPDDLARSMSRIEAEAERMGVLVDDLLLLARLDQGRPLEREPVDLTTVVSDAVDAARVIEPDRVLDADLGSSVSVAGDAGRLRQVVDNLLENARVHTPAGTPTHVRLQEEASDVVLTVADEGPGMDAEVAAKAFERFYRGDPARARSTGGAGLGLAIVAAIIDAHGGSVRVLDTESGATIEVRIPHAPARPAPPPPPPG
ncbi:MAG: sensor histidine kinase [Actinomycetota bacterium]